MSADRKGLFRVTPQEIFRSALSDQGWVVLPAEILVDDMWRVSVDHAVSYRHGFSGPVSPKSSEKFIKNCLNSREFEIVARRPELIHESLIGAIRVAAAANRFDPWVVAIFARVLHNQKLLTESEAAWLEEAGPAWME